MPDITPVGRSLVVGNDVHGSLLGAGRGAVDADVHADQVLLHVGSDTVVGVDQTSGALIADLAVVEDILGPRRYGSGSGISSASRSSSVSCSPSRISEEYRSGGV